MSEIDIYRRFRAHGLSEAGTIGAMANAEAESNLCSFRKQNDFSVNYSVSRQFTEEADRGERNESMQTKGGYGLFMWGGNRKYGLLMFARERGVSVGDEMLAVDYAMKELQAAEYKTLLNALKTTDSIETATVEFLIKFERPRVPDSNNRISKARELYKRLCKLEQTEATNVNETIQAAVNWAINMANDNSHGYDQASRWGPNYDCSSFLITAWQQAGAPVKTNGATYTGNMRAVFQRCGFTVLSPNAEKQIGDVLLNDANHTAMYIGDNQVVQASINEHGTVTGGQSGDQTGREISVRGYYDYPWDCVLRYTGNPYAGSYSDDDEVVYATPSAPPHIVNKCTVILPELDEGCRNTAVKSMQLLLIANKYSCGGSGADGDFGTGTLQGLQNFQNENGLEPDGICGSMTWARLIGGVND